MSDPPVKSHSGCLIAYLGVLSLASLALILFVFLLGIAAKYEEGDYAFMLLCVVPTDLCLIGAAFLWLYSIWSGYDWAISMAIGLHGILILIVGIAWISNCQPAKHVSYPVGIYCAAFLSIPLNVIVIHWLQRKNKPVRSQAP